MKNKIIIIITYILIFFNSNLLSNEDNNQLGVAIVYAIPALNVRDLLEFTI